MSLNHTPRRIRMIMNLRENGIRDPYVLNAMERVPRELFIPEHFHDKAYENRTLPIGLGQTISQPLVVAAMTQALELHDRHRVLEIGTGSGYQAAVLAQIARRVYSVERHRKLATKAEGCLLSLGITTVTQIVGDGTLGWSAQAPFPRIIVTAAAFDAVPPALTQQLSDDGILVIPINDKIHVYRKQGDSLIETPLMNADFVPLISDKSSKTKTAEAPQAPSIVDALTQWHKQRHAFA